MWAVSSPPPPFPPTPFSLLFSLPQGVVTIQSHASIFSMRTSGTYGLREDMSVSFWVTIILRDICSEVVFWDWKQWAWGEEGQRSSQENQSSFRAPKLCSPCPASACCKAKGQLYVAIPFSALVDVYFLCFAMNNWQNNPLSLWFFKCFGALPNLTNQLKPVESSSRLPCLPPKLLPFRLN